MRPGLRLVDRLLLIGAWAISCSAVYGLGFYTGSQIQERVPDDEERIVRLPVTAEPPAAGQRAKAGDDFTFYDTLVGRRGRGSDAVTADSSAPGPPVRSPRQGRGAAPRATPATGSSPGEERPRRRPLRARRLKVAAGNGEEIVVAQGLVAGAGDDDGVACEGRRDRHAGEARGQVRVGAGAAPAPISDRRRPAPRRAGIRGASDRDRVQNTEAGRTRNAHGGVAVQSAM
jgi:hypothetical protein